MTYTRLWSFVALWLHSIMGSHIWMAIKRPLLNQCLFSSASLRASGLLLYVTHCMKGVPKLVMGLVMLIATSWSSSMRTIQWQHLSHVPIVLGPLLFLIYVDNMVSLSISVGSQISMYAATSCYFGYLYQKCMIIVRWGIWLCCLGALHTEPYTL